MNNLEQFQPKLMHIFGNNKFETYEKENLDLGVADAGTTLKVRLEVS